MDLHLAGPGDVPKQLESLYDRLATFCREHSIDLHMSGLTRTLLAFKNDAHYPVGTSGRTIVIGSIWFWGFILWYGCLGLGGFVFRLNGTY